MQVGDLIEYRDKYCTIKRIFAGSVMFETPDGKLQSVDLDTPTGRTLKAITEQEYLQGEIMPIKGLTTSNEGRLPYIGVLRKGGEKQTKQGEKGSYQVYGKDLDYFRFTSDDESVSAAFATIYGQMPKAITVTLPFKTTDENFDAWKEHWVAGGLKHRCDGETMTRWQMADGTYSDEPKACTGGCKEVGRLKVFIRELKRMALVTVLTSSKHDIVSIYGALKDLENRRGDLSGIPFLIKRKLTKISANEKGKRVTREKNLIQIEPLPEWAEMQIEAMITAALPTSQQLALPPAPDEFDEEIDGFEEGEIHDGEVIAVLDEARINKVESLYKSGNYSKPYAEWLKEKFNVTTTAELSAEIADGIIAKLTTALNKSAEQAQGAK